MQHRLTIRTVTSLSALLLGACSLAPDFITPETPKAEAFKEVQGPVDPNAPVWQPANPQAADEKRSPWWESYNDPVLNDLEVKVTNANQNLKIAIAQYDEAREAARAAKADLFPTIGAIAGYGRASTVAPAGATTEASAAAAAASSGNTLRNKERILGAQLSYEVDVFGRVRNQIASAENEAQATKADLATIDLALHAELATDYFSLRGTDEAITILDQTIASYQKAYDLTKNRFEGGVSPEGDLDQAKAQLENAKTQSADRRLQRAQLEHAIAVLTGEAPANFALAPAPFTAQPIAIDSGVPSQLLERRPDIAAAQLRTQEANANIGVARAAYFPTFNLSGTAGYESTVASMLFDSSSFFWSLGTTAAVTIFDGGRIEALSDEAKAAYQESAAAYRQTVLNAYQETEDNLAAANALSQEQQTQKAATDASHKYLTQANDRYLGGVTTYLEVATAQNTALGNDLTANDVHIRAMAANVGLIQALGGGWSDPKITKDVNGS